MVDRWWWRIILGMVGEHPGNGGLPFLGMWVTILSIDGDHSWEYGSYPWPLSPGPNVVSLVYVSNSKSVVHFLLVDFGEGCRLLGICSMGCWGYVPGCWEYVLL